MEQGNEVKLADGKVARYDENGFQFGRFTAQEINQYYRIDIMNQED